MHNTISASDSGADFFISGELPVSCKQINENRINMTREELIDKINNIKDPVKEIETVYAVLDELGVKYKVTKCPKCKKDLYNIALEELSLIEDASEESDFNKKGQEYVWKYIYKFPVNCGGIVYNQDTDPKYIESFAKANPNKFYVKEYIHKEEELPQQEETINNEI